MKYRLPYLKRENDRVRERKKRWGEKRKKKYGEEKVAGWFDFHSFFITRDNYIKMVRRAAAMQPDRSEMPSI